MREVERTYHAWRQGVDDFIDRIRRWLNFLG
jgi:hypothetical protein